MIATLSEVTPDGEVEYVRDVPLAVRRGVRLGLKPPRGVEPSGRYQLYGIVAEPVRDADLASAKDWALVVAAWPWSRRWHDYGFFKPPADKGLARHRSVWDAAERFRGGWRQYLRDEAAENLFSQQRGAWKAVLFDPNLADESIAPGREYGVPRYKAGKRQPVIVPSIYWGLCRDLGACTERLARMEHTPSLAVLIEATLEGNLFEKHLPRRTCRPVHDSLRTAERATAFMNHAIRVALAGPEDFESFVSAPAADGRPRRLVAEQARRVFLDLMYDAHRRALGFQYEGRSTPLPPGPEQPPASPAPVPWDVLAALVDAYVEEYAAVTPAVRQLALSEALRAIEFPAPIEWEAVGEDSVDACQPTGGNDSAVLVEACLRVVALYRLGLSDFRVPAMLKELGNGRGQYVDTVVQYAREQIRG